MRLWEYNLFFLPILGRGRNNSVLFLPCGHSQTVAICGSWREPRWRVDVISPKALSDSGLWKDRWHQCAHHRMPGTQHRVWGVRSTKYGAGGWGYVDGWVNMHRPQTKIQVVKNMGCWEQWLWDISSNVVIEIQKQCESTSVNICTCPGIQKEVSWNAFRDHLGRWDLD